MKRTFVVLGNYRGGTSVVTGILQKLGLFIGNNLDNDSDAEEYSNYEDLEFQQVDIEDMPIEERNKNHDEWGFKDPMTIQRIEKIYPLLRDPHLICVFRDPWATTQSMMRHNSPYTRASIFQLSNTMNNKMATLVWDTEQILGENCPVLPVSYEAVVRYPEREIRRLAKFLGVSLDEELLQECINLIQK
jgi:hypothetical protein